MIKVRLGIGRMRYMIEPGLYAVGTPAADSPVLVTANYKLSIDVLRRELATINCWLLVLNTFGVNVWCAAGKGTFGTSELIHRIGAVELKRFVDHRRLILPQLGAPGVAAHEVKTATGFEATYGPIQARHIPAYLGNQQTASQEMRRVTFPIQARLAVMPLETVAWAKYGLPLVFGLMLLGGLSSAGFSWQLVRTNGLTGAAILTSAYLGGTVLAPLLLPWLPGRAFCVKGAWLGLLVAASALAVCKIPSTATPDFALAGSYLLMSVATCSFLAMNFTGASTYTSLSGVEREIKLAIPVQATAFLIGFVIWIWLRFNFNVE